MKTNIFILLLWINFSAHAQKAELFLQGEEHPIHELTTEWSFAWNELVSPTEQKDWSNYPTYPLNTLWGNILDSLGNPLPNEGFSSYRLLLRTDAPLEKIGLSLPDTYTAYTMYLNGVEIAKNGSFGTSKESSIPHWLPKTISLPTVTDSSELIVHISNFHHSKGGMKEFTLIGNYEKLRQLRERRLLMEGFLSGVMILGGLVLLSIFLYGRRDFAILYFGMFCFVYSYRIFGTGLYSFHSLFPNIPWSLTIHLEYLSLHLSALIGISYLQTLFPDDAPRKIYSVFLWLFGAFALLTIVSSPYFFTQLIPLFFYSILVCLVAVIYQLFTAYRNRRAGAGFSLLSMGVLAITLSYAIFDYLEFWDAVYEVTVLGYLAFFFLHSSILASRFANSMNKARIEAEQAAEAKSRFLSSVTHELRTPLNSIIGYSQILSETALDIKQKSYLTSIKDSGENLLNMVNEVIEKTAFELQQIQAASDQNYKEVIFNEQKVLGDIKKITKDELAQFITALEVLDLNNLNAFINTGSNPEYLKSLIRKSLAYKDYDAIYQLAEFLEENSL